MFLVLGLGNPGKRYQKTRHNLGFMVLENVAFQWNKRFKQREGSSYQMIQTVVDSQSVFVAKPTTYMNKSGIAAREIMKEKKMDLSHFLVLCDDFNLPLGKIRIRKKGSAGGHNGLSSIIQTLGTEEFPRMRLGIGCTQEINRIDFVLSPFLSSEMVFVNEMIKIGSQGIIDFIQKGIDWTMNYYN